jgi:2-methylisocitrate lyase-like PEP mutase family enzyme
MVFPMAGAILHRAEVRLMTRKTRRQFIQGTSLVAGSFVAHPLAAADASAQPPPSPSGGGSPAARFKQLLGSAEPNLCPVVHDVISAKLSVDHGFPMVLAGGGAISQAQLGLGDYGTLTIPEMIDFTARLAEAVDVPIIADGDDCGGNPLNVARAIRRFERAGAACVLIEDLEGAKHLPGLGENLLPMAQFVDKIKAAVDARREMAILARCDAPLPEAWDRIVAYAAAGADLIMVGAIPQEQGPKVVEVTKRPLLSTRGAPPTVLQKNRVSIAVYSGPLLNAAVGAMDRVLKEIAANGVVSNAGELGIPRERMSRLIGSDVAVAAAKKYNAMRRSQ